MHKKLYDMKLKETPLCMFCDRIDDLPHFFFNCEYVTQFWNLFAAWFWAVYDKYVPRLRLREMSIIFGIASVDDVMFVLNYCLLNAKYYIYRQRIQNINNLDIQAYKSEIRYKLNIERIIASNSIWN